MLLYRGIQVETASYRVKLTTGSVVTMQMTDGDVIMGQITMTDQGQSVNNHIGIQIFDINTGVEVMEEIPTISIKDDATGISRGLPYLRVCFNSNNHLGAPHFGGNFYLAEGTYTVTVDVAGEMAVFEISF